MAKPKTCTWCTMDIDPEDSQVSTSNRIDSTGVKQIWWHTECWTRSVVGSPQHLRGTCSAHCGGDGTEADIQPMTAEEMRSEAMESYRIWHVKEQSEC